MSCFVDIFTVFRGNFCTFPHFPGVHLPTTQIGLVCRRGPNHVFAVGPHAFKNISLAIMMAVMALGQPA
jgi:hypothetical protein